MIDRRSAIALSGAAFAAAIMAPHVARAAAPIAQPPLPYAPDALAPTISARTVNLHYGRHHKSYFDALNPLIAGKPYADMDLNRIVVESAKAGDQAIFNNAGQALNHNLYWDQFKGGPVAPPAALLSAIERDFGSLDALKTQMIDTGSKVFGTGWAWLAKDGNKLVILGMQDAGNPLTEGKTPLLGIDVWEHAYYLDYENRRPAHVKAVLDERVNWAIVAERMG